MTIYNPNWISESEEKVYCPDCNKFEKSECPYPRSNITTNYCKSFEKNNPLTPEQIFQKRKDLEDKIRKKHQVSARIVEEPDSILRDSVR